MRKAPIVSRRYRVLLWCLAFSIAFHFLIVPLIVSLLGFHHSAKPVQEAVYQTRSSSLEIARRPPRPRPASIPQPPTPPHPAAPAKTAQSIQQAQRPERQQAQRREVARIEPRAHVSAPRISSSGIDFAQQQAAFERTIAQLRRESNPVSSAARAVQTPSAPRRYTYDFSGSFGSSPHAEGVLTPVKSWRDGPYDYYYVEYSVQYADGTTETGYVPWPIRYLPQRDPFLQHWEHFPLPVPLPDFRLPAGTDLHPLIAFCLEHVNELSDCPIEHD